MELITKKLASCVLLLFIVSYTAFSQEGCDLPGPSELWVTEVTTTSIAIEWTPVANAAEYLVTTIEVATGDPIASEVVDYTHYENDQLIPGASYEFHVTSLCDNGDSGGTGVLLAETNIIIVDIVMHLDCYPTPGNPTPTQGPFMYPAGNSSEFGFFPTNVLRLDGDVIGGSGSLLDFELVFFFNPATFQLTAGTTSTLSQLIQIMPNAGSGNGLIQFKTNGNWHDLGSFRPVYTSVGSRLEVNWDQDVNVAHTNCSSASFGTWSGGEGSEEEDGGHHLVGAQLAPNPAHDQVLIKVGVETPVRIYDLQGRTWAELYLEPGQDWNLDISQWPNGMYVLQYFVDDQPMTTRLVKN